MLATTPLDLDVTLLCENLLRAIGQVGRAVSASTFPALGCLYLAAADGRVQLSAAAQDQALTTWIGGVITTPGRVLLPHEDLYDTVATWPKDARLRLTRELGRGRIVVHAPGFNTTLDVLPADEFPVVPLAPAGAGGLQFGEARELVGLLNQVRPAAATDSARPILCGVHFKTRRDYLVLEAADGLRIHQVGLRYAAERTIDVVVPSSAVAHAAELLDPAAPLTLIFLERDGHIHQVLFVQETLQILANTLQLGAYPDLASVIPDMRAAPPVTVSLSGTGLLSALARADRLATAHTVRLRLTPGSGVTPGTLRLQAEQAEKGEHVENLTASVSAPFEIAVNARLLMGLLDAHALGSQAPVALRLSSAKDPLTIRTNQFIGVLMPMRF